MVRNGQVAKRGKFLEKSFRRVRQTGDRAGELRRADRGRGE